MGSCAITAFPYDTFGDGWEGAFGKYTILDSNFQPQVSAFQFVSANSTVTEFTTDLFAFSSYIGAVDAHLRLEIVKGAVSTGTGPILAGTVIPCDHDYPYYNDETCIDFHRPWEMGFGVSTVFTNLINGGTDRNTYYGGVGSVMTIGCEEKTESVYYPVNNDVYGLGGPFGGYFSFVHLEQDYSNSIKVSGGPPVDVKYSYGESDVCNNIELQLFDQQGFGWHIPGRVQYTYYSVDTEGEGDTHDLLVQGTLVGCKSKTEKIKLPRPPEGSINFNLRLAGRNDPNEWAHHAVFTTEDSSSESVTIKPGNQIVFSLSSACEVTINSIDTYATASEYGPYDNGNITNFFPDDFFMSDVATLMHQGAFSKGNSLLTSSPSSNNDSFEVSSSAMMIASVGIFVGGLIGMFVEKRRKTTTVSYSSVDESSTHSDLSALKKKVSSAHATAGLV